jgi:hypothetical protein
MMYHTTPKLDGMLVKAIDDALTEECMDLLEAGIEAVGREQELMAWELMANNLRRDPRNTHVVSMLGKGEGA